MIKRKLGASIQRDGARRTGALHGVWRQAKGAISSRPHGLLQWRCRPAAGRYGSLRLLRMGGCNLVLSLLLCGASAPGGAHETKDTAQAVRSIPGTRHHTPVITSSGAYRGGGLAVRIAAGGDVAAAIPTHHRGEVTQL